MQDQPGISTTARQTLPRKPWHSPQITELRTAATLTGFPGVLDDNTNESTAVS